MKNIEVSDEVYAALQRFGADRTPGEALASLLHVPGSSSEAAAQLAGFVLDQEFQSMLPSDQYLAVLTWLSTRHPAEFREFIRARSGHPRSAASAPKDAVAVRRHNHARQIGTTQFWAIMNIDATRRRRLVARLLAFIGYRDTVIELVCATLGDDARARHLAPFALVA